jgi:DNA-binding transcriptional MerR regulator
MITIGELSRRTEVKVPTIRYHEQVGLLPSPPRTQGQQRRYEEGDVSRLNIIRHVRELGFKLDAIRELLTLAAMPEQPCAEVDRLAHRHMKMVERQIRQLTALRKELRRMLNECSHGHVGECRVIETLNR